MEDTISVEEFNQYIADLEADRNAGREWMRMAWEGFNIIRARFGAPPGVDEEWWNNVTDNLGELLGDDAKPWMAGAAKALLDTHTDYRITTKESECAAAWAENDRLVRELAQKDLMISKALGALTEAK